MRDAAIQSLLGFWADAGVDYALEAEPQDRLRAAAPPLAPAAVPVFDASPPVPPVAASPIARARAAAEAAETPEALAQAIAAFDGCPLSRLGATRAVLWRGRMGAPLLVVGEAPGADEDREGLPFVGRAGRLLDRMLSAAGLTDEVLITNTVYWRPPGNRNPAADEIAICRPFLERIAAFCAPKAVLLVGGVAAGAVLGGDGGIMRRRGAWERVRLWTEGPELPVLATLHPAFLLRQPAQKKKAWFDLLEVSARLRSLTTDGRAP